MVKHRKQDFLNEQLREAARTMCQEFRKVAEASNKAVGKLRQAIADWNRSCGKAEKEKGLMSSELEKKVSIRSYAVGDDIRVQASCLISLEMSCGSDEVMTPHEALGETSTLDHIVDLAVLETVRLALAHCAGKATYQSAGRSFYCSICVPKGTIICHPETQSKIMAIMKSSV